MQYVQRKLQRSVTDIRRSRSGRPRESTAIGPFQLARREQKLQHHLRPPSPCPLAVVPAAVFVVAEIGVGPAFRVQPVAQEARVVERLSSLAPADVKPDPRTRTLEGVDLGQDHAI